MFDPRRYMELRAMELRRRRSVGLPLDSMAARGDVVRELEALRYRLIVCRERVVGGPAISKTVGA
jgi:hypothetical protein